MNEENITENIETISVESSNKFESNINETDIAEISNDINKQIEKTRSTLANVLIILMISTYVGCFIILGYLISHPEIETGNKGELFSYTKDIFTLLLTTQTGLVGTALGFYFGSRSNK